MAFITLPFGLLPQDKIKDLTLFKSWIDYTSRVDSGFIKVSDLSTGYAITLVAVSSMTRIDISGTSTATLNYDIVSNATSNIIYAANLNSFQSIILSSLPLITKLKAQVTPTPSAIILCPQSI